MATATTDEDDHGAGHGLVDVLQQPVEGHDDEHQERRLHQVGDEAEPDQRGAFASDVLGGGGGVTRRVDLCSPDLGEAAEDRDDQVERPAVRARRFGVTS